MEQPPLTESAQDSGRYRVMRRMEALLHNLRALLPSERHASLRNLEERLQGTVARAFEDEKDKRDASVPDRQGLGLGEEAPNPSAARR